MPFLTKKTGDAENSALLHSSLGTSTEWAWRDDEYKPSKSPAGLGGAESSPSLLRAQHRGLCANPACTNGWTRPWRSRRRPIFEGQWGCSGRCVLTMTRAAVRRELGAGGAFSLEPHRHRVPLGLMMLAQGWITHPQLQRALAAQRENGTGRIGDWLISECGLDPEQVVRGLSLQWGCPVLTTEGFSPEAMALVVPKLFVEQFGLLPLRVAGSRILYLGFADRLDASSALATEQMTELKVESGVVESAQFEVARKKLLAHDGVEVKLETAEDKDRMTARITAILEQKQPVASRLVRLHQYYWLRIWLESGSLSKSGSLPATGEDVMDYVFTVAAPE
jgi:Type II secretion system (T2SS), protein E, N-terminal domain